MELRKVADALLRCQVSPLPNALNPTSTVRWTSSRQLAYNSPSCLQSRRCLSTTAKRAAIRPSATTTSTPPSDPNSPIQSTPESKPKPMEDTLEALTSSLWAAPVRPSRNSTWATGGLPRTRSPLPSGNSASDLLATLQRKRANEAAAQSRVGSTSILDDMLMPGSASGRTAGDMMYEGAKGNILEKREIRTPIKLNPSTGRSVTVGQGMDIGRGIKLLEMSCARNKVRRDQTTQRFHERGGMKRKRLRRERWRKRFLEGFKETCRRVRELKKQGW